MKNDNLYALFEAQFPRDLNAPFLETTGAMVYSRRDLHYGSPRLAGCAALRGLTMPRVARRAWQCRWKSLPKRCCSNLQRCVPGSCSYP
jgi:hypothetical protein